MQFKFVFLNVFAIYLFDGFEWVEFNSYLHTFTKFFKNNHKFLENNKHNMSLKFMIDLASN